MSTTPELEIMKQEGFAAKWEQSSRFHNYTQEEIYSAGFDEAVRILKANKNLLDGVEE